MSDIKNLEPLVLYPSDSTSKSSVDIVAVYGLNGERTASWTNADDTMWLRDVLPGPDRIPSACVMTFGYVSESPEAISAEGMRKTALELLRAVMQWRNTAREEEADVSTSATNSLGKREGHPIVFIGYDIGGAIIKQALLIANNENRYLSIAADTSLLVFFGTPHRASTFADWNDLTINIAATTLNKPKAVFSEVLKSSVKVLMDLSAEFLPFAGGISILNIHGFEVVDEYSSRFGIPTEENVFILTDIGKHLYDAIVCDAIQRSITTARKYDSEGIICLQTFLALNLEIRQPAIPWPGPDLITSSWIFSHETYVDWLGHPQPAILCLYGKPGSGKSVLSSLVIRNLRLSSAERKRAIVFFFCDEQGERWHSTRDLLSSLIHQLLVQQPSLFRHVRSLWALKRDKSNWTRPELQVLFRAIIYSREEVEIVCIIDGLDRCDPSHLQLWEDLVDTTIIYETPVTVATLLDDLEDSDDDPEGSDDDPPDDSEEEDTPIPAITQTSLKFLITTRRPLETHTPRGCCFSIDIETQGGVRGDMVGLLATGVKDLVRKRPGFSGFEEIISTKLLSTPDATLLTASLCLDELETIVVSSAPASIQKMLNSISFTRDGIYARHLQSISPDWHEWAHDVLFWVLYAVRPLTVHELALALAIKQDDKSLAAIVGNISQDLAGDIERVFRGLIIIKHGEVRLSHPTIKEFILCGFRVHEYWYQIYSCNPHCRIARTCLTYLSMEDFAHVSSLAEIDGNPLLPEPQWGFLTYAAQHWHEHYRLVGEEESGMLFDVLNFLTEQIEAKGLHRAILGSGLSVQWDSKLHIAAGLGLREVVLELLGKTPSEEQVTKVLEWAARNGHDILVNQLLTDPEYLVAIGQDSSALRSATQNGHESTVKMLLQYEAKTDSPSASGNGALPLAARGGHTEVVKMLLALSVDLASRSTAFHQAVSGGHESVVKLLLDTEGINLEEKCTESELPPLHVAARGGYVGVVRQLLAHGASARSTSHQELTPLHLAAQGGHLNIVNQLLKAHATIDALDGIKFTPLHHACKQGHAAVVGYLLNAEADGNLAARFKKTPLQTAAQYGHTKVIAQLLDAGVEVNTKSKDGWTALHVGVRDGRVDAVELLLKAGADIDATTRKGSTALFLAAELGNVGITKLLLDNGANPRETNKTQSTPLHRASQKGRLGVVKLLLAADASPLVENDNGDTPLAVAEIEGHTTILAELDVDRQDKDGRTRLFHACSKEVVNDIQELLEAKADPNIRDNDGRLPLDVLLSPRGRLLFLKSIKGGAGVAKIQTLDGHPPCTRVQRKIKEWLVCDICRKDIFEEVTVFYYHCCKCGDNYDLCRPCYSGGIRCPNDEHTMRLRVIADGLKSYAEYTPLVSRLRWPLVESGDVKD